MSKLMFYSSDNTAVEVDIYQSSMQFLNNDMVFMAATEYGDVLVITSNGQYRILELNHESAMFLRKNFPFTAPSPVLRLKRTIGTGDRLGVAGDGHISCVKTTEYAPVLAQQSIRELNLTGRSYEDVLDAATFAVFKNGYKKPWGADGDHLKKPEEIEYAISCGYTMVTLDCSEYIKTGIDTLSDEQLNEIYTADNEREALYIGHSFEIAPGTVIEFNERIYKECVVVYGTAIDFIEDMYALYIQNGMRDFEISIDETTSPTTPAQHFFVANELERRGVKFDTLAPRFCGEFQKGIDYIGDLKQFEDELKIHALIAEKFDYKLSIHSGSDKFSVFPIIGKLTNGRFHLKTAGTNWLEAMKLIALQEPQLYREVHKFALSNFDEARKYYVVTTDVTNIPDIDNLADEQLPELFENNDARQLIHITYGLILSETNADGSYVYRNRLYDVWRNYKDQYSNLIASHIGRHISQLDSLIAIE